MSKPITLSVVLATHNEAANLARCLGSVKGLADEIIVVDGQSMDETVKIAKTFSARIIPTTNKANFHINKNMAIAAAKGTWILQLDADEAVSPELLTEIATVITTPSDINGYWMNRRNWFLSRFLTKGGQYPDPTLRLYRRGFGRLPAKDVHEQAQVTGRVGHLRHDLLHYRDTSFAKYLVGVRRYSDFVAGQLARSQTPINFSTALSYLFIRPWSAFLLIYLRHKGVVDGWPGFVFALFSGLRYPLAYLKYWRNSRHLSV